MIEIETILRQGKTIRIKPQGYSMYPLFVPGRDLVEISGIQITSVKDRMEDNNLPRPLKRGDVVLYRRKQGILVLHRIWKVRDGAYYMVGDNQTQIEGPISAEQIKGILTGFVRKEKAYSVQNIGYRFLSGTWLWLRPVRHMIAVPVAKVKKICKGLTGSRRDK